MDVTQTSAVVHRALMASSVVRTGSASDERALGDLLLRLRTSRGLSLRGVAVRLGCHHTLVLRWEQGVREPAVHDLVAIARLFGVEVDEVLRGAILVQGRVSSSRAHGRRSRQRLASRLREARVGQGLGHWDVYVATGIPGRRLRTIEAGADPSLREIQLLASALEVRATDLLSPLSTSGSDEARPLGAPVRGAARVSASGGSPLRRTSLPADPPR